MADTRYFVDIMSEIVAAVRAEYDTTSVPSPVFPVYIHDHPVKVANRLVERDHNKTLKFQKYPLITLFEDFIQKDGGFEHAYLVDCTILILDYSEKTRNSDERYEQVIKPILHPIYELLLQSIEDSKYIETNGVESIDKDMYIRPAWGEEGKYGNVGLIFNDNTDGIQINLRDLKVVSYNNCT